MLDKIHALLSEIEQLAASGADELEALRIKYLSKKGIISVLMDDFRNVAPEQKREVGMRLNELKQKAQEKIQSLKEQFESNKEQNTDIDLTRTAYPISLGTRHPISIVKEEICDIFKRLGFSIATNIEADILIVDEVLAVGDIAFQGKCFDKMEDLILNQQKTVLLVSHNPLVGNLLSYLQHGAGYPPEKVSTAGLAELESPELLIGSMTLNSLKHP